MKTRVFLGSFFFLLLAFPYLSLIAQIGEWPSNWAVNVDETVSVLGFTFLQAFLSAVLSFAVGLLGAFGLNAFASSGRNLRVAEIFVLLPNAAPVLLLLLAVFKFFPWARGFEGILFVHVMLNSGLVAVSLVALFQMKVGGLAELAWIEGATKFQFLRAIWSELKTDFAVLALFVFAICFASFSVPLLIGGSRATTMETLIFQKIRLSGDWGEAVALASIQASAVFLISCFLNFRTSPALTPKIIRLPLLSWKPGLLPLLLPPLLLLFGLFSGLAKGLGQLAALEMFHIEFWPLLQGSVLVGFGTGFLVALLLAILAYVAPKGLARRALLGYAAPSAVLMGFAILFFWRATGFASYIKIVLGLSLASVPAFYRLQWDSVLTALDGQRLVARTLGADDWLIFSKIVWPQIVTPAFRIAGLASVWAWGDFSLSSVVAERTLSLAMVIQGLMGSYRLDAATALVWVIVVGAGLSYLFFKGVGRVLGSSAKT
jgi:thiamine transport system permease protein